MNKPAVLTLVDEKKGAFYAALTNLRGNTATVVLGQEARVVELEEINRTWSGEYLLLWRAPPDYRGEVKPGSRGPMAAWLKRHLALAQGRTPPAKRIPNMTKPLSGRSKDSNCRRVWCPWDRRPDDHHALESGDRYRRPGAARRERDLRGMSYILEALKKLERKRQQEENVDPHPGGRTMPEAGRKGFGLPSLPAPDLNALVLLGGSFSGDRTNCPGPPDAPPAGPRQTGSNGRPPRRDLPAEDADHRNMGRERTRLRRHPGPGEPESLCHPSGEIAGFQSGQNGQISHRLD